MLDLRTGKQGFGGGHDLGDARLVVGAQKGVAARDDEFLSDVVFQKGKFFFGEDFSVFQRDVPAPVEDTFRLHVLPRTDGLGVHVGDESQSGRPLRVGGNFRVDVTMFVHPDLFGAHGSEFVREQTS